MRFVESLYTSVSIFDGPGLDLGQKTGFFFWGGGVQQFLQGDAVNCHRLVTTLSVHLLSIPPFNTDLTYRYCRLYSTKTASLNQPQINNYLYVIKLVNFVCTQF